MKTIEKFYILESWRGPTRNGFSFYTSKETRENGKNRFVDSVFDPFDKYMFKLYMKNRNHKIEPYGERIYPKTEIYGCSDKHHFEKRLARDDVERYVILSEKQYMKLLKKEILHWLYTICPKKGVKYEVDIEIINLPTDRYPYKPETESESEPSTVMCELGSSQFLIKTKKPLE